MVVAWTISVIAFAQTPLVLPAAIFLLLSGILSSIFLATNQTLLQIRSDEEHCGRVLGVVMVTWGMMPFGSLFLGSLAGRIDPPDATVIACLIGLLIIGMIAWRNPALR